MNTRAKKDAAAVLLEANYARATALLSEMSVIRAEALVADLSIHKVARIELIAREMRLLNAETDQLIALMVEPPDDDDPDDYGAA